MAETSMDLGQAFATEAQIFDDTPCLLGEGPLWHPLRNTLIWFDIHGRKMHLRSEDGDARRIALPHKASAAGWVSRDEILVADAQSLSLFHIEQERFEPVIALEPDNPVTRSNDGRADPWGGFWIGTMGDNLEPGAGAIYRYYRGELRQLIGGITIPNALCFAPDQSCAYYTDTADGRVMRIALAAENGWPIGNATTLINFQGTKASPDGAVTDAKGNLWIALWGVGKVACFSPQGQALGWVAVPASDVTCPAFGGAGLSQLFVTSAAQNDATPQAGRCFQVPVAVRGRAEPRVVLAG